MATVSAKVYQHHHKTDGTFNVKICVYHKNERKFIDTEHYVTQKQLDSKHKIKDKFILSFLDNTLKEYRESISSLGSKIEFFSAEALRDYLRDKGKDIDFIEFCNQHIEQLRKEKRNGTANNHRTIRNSLVDYFKRTSVSIDEVNSNMLLSYEKYLKTDRIMNRINQLGKEVETIEKAMSESGIHNHMRDLRTLFNAARKFYNNEDLGIFRIKHYPFIKYKIGSAPLTKKRNISIDEIRKIRNCQVTPDSRVELARDLFMLSFYTCGMNAVDFYNLDKRCINGNRLEYNRSKTCGVRKDNAFISIKIVGDAKPLLEKYLGVLKERYSSHGGLDTALCKGMKQLQKLTGIPSITFYWARHSFANIARNKCRMTKDDVSLALNHVDEGHRTTDIYIEKDWTIVDDVQEKVLAVLNNDYLDFTNEIIQSADDDVRTHTKIYEMHIVR